MALQPAWEAPGRRRIRAGLSRDAGGEPGAGLLAYNANDTGTAARTDYCANAGDTVVMWGSGPNPTDALAGTGFADMGSANGIVFQRSQIKITSIKDGTSSTYLLGDADVGTQLHVEVTYTDANGTAAATI